MAARTKLSLEEIKEMTEAFESTVTETVRFVLEHYHVFHARHGSGPLTLANGEEVKAAALAQFRSELLEGLKA